MTITTTATKTTVLGNGSTVTFSWQFLIQSQVNLEVATVSPTGQVTILNATTYTVANGSFGNLAGGSLTYPIGVGTPLASGWTLTIERITPNTQPTSLANQGAFYPAAVEGAMDNLAEQIQELFTDVQYSITQPLQDVSPISQLPTAAVRANQVLGFDGNGNPLMYAPGPVSLVNATNSNYTAPYTGALTRSVAARLSESVSVGDFVGADPTGVTSSSAAIAAAAATGKPVYFPAGTWKNDLGVACSTPDQVFWSDGMSATINAPVAFATSGAAGNFYWNGASTNDHGPQFRGLHFTCDQSVVAASGTRANLNLYPPCLYLRNCGRWHVIDCRIEFYTYGIDSQGSNSPGPVIQNLELGCYSAGLALDGNGDTAQFDDIHDVSFNGWTTNQRAILADGNTIGISVGNCAGLNLNDFVLYGPTKAINGFVGTGVNQVTDPVTGQSLSNAGSPWNTGMTFGQVVNGGFDTYAGIYWNMTTSASSFLLLSNCYFSTTGAVTATQWINQTGGIILAENCYFSLTQTLTNPPIVLNNTSGGTAYLKLTGSYFGNNGDHSMILVSGTSPCLVNISDNDWVIPANNTNANIIVSWTNNNASGGLTWHDNQFTPKGTGALSGVGTTTSAAALSVANDGQHFIHGNGMNGWAIAVPTVGVPTTFTSAKIYDNGNRGTLNYNNANLQTFSAMSGLAATIPANTVVYLGPLGNFATAGTNTFVVPKAGIITGFTVTASSGPSGAQTYIYTMYHNGAGTTMTGGTTGASGVTTVVSNPFVVAAGDTIELQLGTSATAVATYHKFGISFEPA